MVRKRDAGYRNLGQMALFKALDLLSGHSRELAPRPSSYKIQRKLSVFIPPTGPANWPGVEAPTDLPHLPPRAHCLTPPPSRDLDNPFVTQSPSRDDTDFDDPFVTPPPSRYGTDLDDPFEQAQSPLFRLPSGVLRLIYEEVIGNRTIHIVRRQDRLGHALCSINTLQSQEQCRETQCRGLKWPNGTYEPGLGCSDILPLLKTCRKTYGGAIDVLYSSNTFDFDSMESIISFSIAIVPKRLDSIQQLQLALDFGTSRQFAESTAYNDPPRWERTWRVVGSLKSLQMLWVWIEWHRPVFRPVEESWLVDHLDQVRQLEVFEVSLPSLKGKEVKRERELLFNVTRRS